MYSTPLVYCAAKTSLYVCRGNSSIEMSLLRYISVQTPPLQCCVTLRDRAPGEDI